ncbi:protein ALP1-like [Rhodamnia argentea]|uniref:Protein ALP1-like n=1 Tax=Rhodamnia argentea TaxID=178133 RepID=A0A8B8P5Q2_9MYRT|nr:protein ALP1-like [Rhodamnia argentea]
MEISSSPFLTQEDYSHIFSFFQQQDMDAFNLLSNPSKRRRFDDPDDHDSQAPAPAAAPLDLFASLFSFDGDDTPSEDEDQKWVRVEEHPRQIPVPGPNSQRIGFEADEAKNKSGSNKRARRPAANGNNSGSPGPVEPVSGSTRRLWVKDRKKEWWDNLNRPDVPDEEFRAAFRMSRATFDMICDELDAAVTKKNTTLREAVPVRQRVAVCIWRLATGEPLRLVSNRFGLGISTCHKLVLEVCAAIKDVLMPKFLQWPDEPQLGRIKRRFESLSGIPNVAGSMYTTHMPIIAPKSQVAEYYNKRHTERNQRTSYSITVQGVVDDRGAFTDICIGWPGSLQDDQVLEKSALYQRASRGLLRDLWIVGNSGHPLTDWVLAPYTQKNQTWAQHEFNERVGEVQGVAREAFARLKGRWACLQKRTEVKLQDLPVVLGACCILHNICQMREEAVTEAERFELYDDEMVAEKAVRSAAAQQARDHIAHNLLHHGPARP